MELYNNLEYLTIGFASTVDASVGNTERCRITFSVNNFLFPVLLARYFFHHLKMRKDSLRMEVKILLKTTKI